MSLPTIRIRNLTVSRLVVGGNPISGFSHAGPARTTAMLDYFTAENAKKLLRHCEECGINTGFMRADNHIIRLLREYWNEGGKIQWFAQTGTGESPDGDIRKAKACGAKAIYVHGGAVDSFCGSGDCESLRKQLDLIRELGLPAGCAGHNPQYLLEIERQSWAPDFYMVCLYNVLGYKGKLNAAGDEKFAPGDRKIALDAIAALPRPCFAYKILAAGRLNPREAFNEVFSRIKSSDGVAVGMFPPDAKSGDIVAENVAYVNEFAAT